MHLLNSLYQKGPDRSYRADGSLASGSPKLILPQATSRSFITIQNLASGAIFVEHGCARATATLTNGVVTSISILNAGFGFTAPPQVQFKGGGGQIHAPLSASGWDGRGQIDDWPTPAGNNLLVTPPVNFRPAKATAVLTAGVVTSFAISDGGAGYVYAPEVLLTNDPLDPFGCADPSLSSGSGFHLAQFESYTLNGTFCHTDAIALFAASPPAAYYVEYAP